MSKLQLTPITFAQASEFVNKKHRHHRAPQGHKFSIGVQDAVGELRGVVIVGRPVARGNDDRRTLEITRCCTDGTKNAASMLMGAAWRAAKALGYTRMITYTRADETGISLTAAGFTQSYTVKAKSWNTPSRPRKDKTEIVQRSLWEVKVNDD